MAAQGDKPATLLALHHLGLDVNAVDSKGSTALHWASFSGGDKVVEYLLAQKGIKVNCIDS